MSVARPPPGLSAAMFLQSGFGLLRVRAVAAIRKLRASRLARVHWKLGLVRLLVSSAAFAGLLTAGGLYYFYFDRNDLPDLGGFTRFEFPAVGHIYDANGQPLKEMASESRQITRFGRLACRSEQELRPAYTGSGPHGRGRTRAVTMVMKESQQISAEHRDLAAHAHRTGAERHGKGDHLSGHESSRQALEHSNQAFVLGQQEHERGRTAPGSPGSTHAPGEQDIAAHAYGLWQRRGCPEGSPERDWFRAVEEIRSGHSTQAAH